MKKPEYSEGPEARKKFDEGMTKLFQAKKLVAPKGPTKRKEREGNKNDKSH